MVSSEDTTAVLMAECRDLATGYTGSNGEFSLGGRHYDFLAKHGQCLAKDKNRKSIKEIDPTNNVTVSAKAYCDAVKKVAASLASLDEEETEPKTVAK